METDKTVSFCTFRVDDRLYGTDILQVKEINTDLSITPIHHTSDSVAGYVNIRGKIHLILNLKNILGLASWEVKPNSKLILFQENVGPSFGILVDQVGDIVDVDDDEIEDRRRSESIPPDGVERRNPNIGMGVCKLEGELMVVLNPNKFLDTII